jgi:hypothetical protein
MRKVSVTIVVPLIGVVMTACGSAGSSISQGSSQTSATSSGAKSQRTLEVTKVGFGTSDTGTTAVVVFKNDSTSEGAGEITAQFTAYDVGGSVLGTGETNLALVRSEQTMAAASDISVPSGSKVDHVKAQLAASQWDSDPHPDAVITARNVSFAPDPYFPKINGELVSHYTSDLKEVIATAVCYDTAGKIVGGGDTFVSLLPGGGTAGASVQGNVTGTPGSCEIFATLSNLSVLAASP